MRHRCSAPLSALGALRAPLRCLRTAQHAPLLCLRAARSAARSALRARAFRAERTAVLRAPRAPRSVRSALRPILHLHLRLDGGAGCHPGGGALALAVLRRHVLRRLLPCLSGALAPAVLRRHVLRRLLPRLARAPLEGRFGWHLLLPLLRPCSASSNTSHISISMALS